MTAELTRDEFIQRFLKQCDDNLVSLNIQYEIFARVVERLFIETGLVTKEQYLKIRDEEQASLMSQLNQP